MAQRELWRGTALALAMTLLAGCNEPAAAPKAGLAGDRADATGQAARDPAMRAALEDQIMVDPKLVGQANRNAVTPGNAPVDGQVPAVVNARSGRDAEAAAAAALAGGGGMMRAPAPTTAADESCTDCAANQPVTLGGRAARQQGQGGCDAQLAYGNEWAQRLPAAFPLYPQAHVKEAAGVAGGKCNIRVVNFETAASLQSVVDYYYTLGRRAGYAPEHRLAAGDHQVGGVRGEEAYVVMARRDGQLTDVDIIVSGGR